MAASPLLTTSLRAKSLLAAAGTTALLASAMVGVAALPARAADATVTTVQGLLDAVDAANLESTGPHTITLGADLAWPDDATAYYSGDGTFTLDGAGHTVTLADPTSFLIATPATGDVLVKDLTLTGTASNALVTIGNSVTLESLTVMNVTADGPPVVAMGPSIQVNGSTFTGNSSTTDIGALLAVGDYIEIRNSAFTGNTAAGSGGAVLAAATNDTLVDHSTFTGNSAGSNGGAIYAANGFIQINDSVFTSNTSEANGGAIMVGNDSLSGWRNSFIGNSAHASGGAIFGVNYVDSYSSTFSANSAVYSGGAIYAAAQDTYSFHWNSTFTGNTAGDAGGAIFMPYEFLETYHVTFAHNDADEGAHVAFGEGALYPYATAFVGASGDGCSFDVFSEGTGVYSWGYNFDQDGSCTDFWSEEGDIGDGLDAQLGALANNGGPTPTRLPSASSPLVDAVDLVECQNAMSADSDLELDQRGVSRVDVLTYGDGGCDIGAVEVVKDLTFSITGPTGPTQFTLKNAITADPACQASLTLAQAGGTPPAGEVFPHGGFEFCALVGVPGVPVTVSLTTPTVINRVYKVANGVWTAIPGATFPGSTTVTYLLLDGGPLDADGLDDGWVHDPVVPGAGVSFTG